MDCRRALEILEFSDRESDGAPADFCSAEDRGAAEAHLESCAACAQTVGNCRQLDRAIGQVMRAVPIPRGAQQRLLARLAEVETDAVVNGSNTAGSGATAGNGLAGEKPPATATPARPSALPSRRRFLRGLIPAVACLSVASVAFFGVVWMFSPRWTVDQVSKELAKLDFDSLETLANFTGGDPQLPSGWDRPHLLRGGQAKGLPAAPNVIAVYSFDIPKNRRHGAARGLLAVIPRNRVRNQPEADSLSRASATSEYVDARLGESVCVAWQEGNVVCVCLIQGGPDSLSTLQGILEQPSA
jgi:hypothetical protein